jgi:hypothetical protein
MLNFFLLYYFNTVGTGFCFNIKSGSKALRVAVTLSLSYAQLRKT